ncbi:hypothetical protein EJF36_06680 [Bacillus sp. HMF5848]|uniref:DUF6258 family protein n=1 Tax=Bacillus sp. HMF5848 TaxID=2495421 RepID=UPI000F77EB54|nr:DUF6258 family protein [Bacillus sp. HMF5848]RSK26569.1 hypothetical protein EJF36_06680 [Bacillus sp. HMF5848]
MNNPIEFLNTIYFGDRYCERINIEGDVVELQINLVSRIRRNSGEWNFYSAEDIENGVLVFSGVEEVQYDDTELLPNDEIYNISVKPLENNYEFKIEAGHVNQNAEHYDVIIILIAKELYLKDPKNPNTKIVN